MNVLFTDGRLQLSFAEDFAMFELQMTIYT